VSCGVLTEERYFDKGGSIQLDEGEKLLTGGAHGVHSDDEQHAVQENEMKGHGSETHLADDVEDSSWGP
jgi:hypothetical protein